MERSARPDPEARRDRKPKGSGSQNRPEARTDFRWGVEGRWGVSAQKAWSWRDGEVSEAGSGSQKRPEAERVRKPEQTSTSRVRSEPMSPRKRGKPGPFCVAHDIRKPEQTGSPKRPERRVSRLPARSCHAPWHDRRHGLAHAGETGNAARSQGLCWRPVRESGRDR